MMYYYISMLAYVSTWLLVCLYDMYGYTYITIRCIGRNHSTSI